MGNMFLTGISDVTCPLVIHPEWSFRDEQILQISRHRTQTGRQYAVQWGGFRAFNIPLRFVDSTDQSKIFNWWKTQDQVAFTLDSSASGSTFLCRITNPANPLGKHSSPYQNLFEGQLHLESLDNSDPIDRPFILDDPLFGLLDNPLTALA